MGGLSSIPSMGQGRGSPVWNTGKKIRPPNCG